MILWMWRPRWPPFEGPDGQGPVLVPLLNENRNRKATIWGLRWPGAGSGAPANRDLNKKPPFGGPDGLGPVLVPLLIRTLIESHHFGAQMARGRFQDAKIRSLNELDVAKIERDAPQVHGAQARAPQSAI